MEQILVDLFKAHDAISIKDKKQPSKVSRSKTQTSIPEKDKKHDSTREIELRGKNGKRNPNLFKKLDRQLEILGESLHHLEH